MQPRYAKDATGRAREGQSVTNQNLPHLPAYLYLQQGRIKKMKITIDVIKEANKKCGGKWCDRETIDFFSSRISKRFMMGRVVFTL